MKLIIVSVFLAVTAFAPGLSAAQDFDAGWEALRAGDYETALTHLEPLAARGDDRAMVGIGFMYRHGYGVPEDYTEAFRNFREAAELGNADATYAIASGFYFGEWLDQDFELAIEWYRRAEAIMEEGPAKAKVEGFRQTAEAVAQIVLGAANGNLADQVALANRYADDPDLKNLERSARWFRAAAEQDHVDAQLRIAAMNQLGQGVTPNSVEAHFWYSVAATRGAGDAARLRDRIAGSLSADSLGGNRARLEEWLSRHPR